MTDIQAAPDTDGIWRQKVSETVATVTSVFGRVGAVLAQLGDYAASLVSNDSTVPGATVAAALDALLAAIAGIPPAPVSSVFARTGAVVATLGDYVATLIGNDSTVAGATVAAALDNLKASITPADNWRFVSPSGSDVTGNGSIAKPWASVTAAMAAITDAAPTKRYTIWVMGRVTEAGAVVLKPNVFIAGVSPQNSRCSATSWTLDASFGTAGDHRTGFIAITVNGPITADFNALGSNEGKLYFQGAWVNSAVTATRFSDINQIFALQALTFAGWTFNGCAVTSQCCFFQGGVTFVEGPGAGRFQLDSNMDSFLGGLSLTKVAAGGDAAALRNSYVSALTVAGSLTVDANSCSIPTAPTLSGGALINNGEIPRTAGTNSRRWLSGTGSPNGAVTGSPGDLYTSDAGGAGTTLYVKETGSNTNTGWVAK